jgi:hypothetical protein
MTKRNIMLLCWFVAMIAMFCGCSPHSDSKTASTSVDPTSASAGRDLTIAVRGMDVTMPPQYTVQSTADYHYPAASFDDLVNHSSLVIKGRVQEVAYTTYDGGAYTAVNIIVDDVLNGDLNVNDIITTIHSGGYTTLQEEIETFGGAEKFSDIPEEDWASTIIHYPVNGWESINIGQDIVMFLNPSTLFDGAYVPLNDDWSRYHMKDDGTFQRSASLANDGPGISAMRLPSSSVNNIQELNCFTYEWLESQFLG